MISVHGYYENGVCVPTEKLNLKEKQRVIITVIDEVVPQIDATKSESRIRFALDDFRGKSTIWNELVPLDYTEWRETLFNGVDIETLANEANKYSTELK